MEGLTVEQQKDCDNSIKEWISEENNQLEQDKKLLSKIKECVSTEVFGYIEYELQESGITRNYRIVPEPLGDLQDWVDHKTWVSQSCGISGDDFSGTVCMKLTDDKYLIWDFWM